MTEPAKVPPLEVAVILPAAPYVLAGSGFVATLAAVEKQIAELKIVTPQDNQAAADLLTRLTTASGALEKQRKALVDPFLTAQRAINEAAKGPQDRIEVAKRALRVLQVDYDTKQRKAAADAEDARQAELARLEKIKADQLAVEAAKAKALADDLAAKQAAQPAAAAPAVLDLDLDGDVEIEELAPPPPPPTAKSEIERQIEAVRHAPAVVAPKAAGVAFRVTLVPVLVDINKVPDMFVEKTLKTKALISTYCTGYKEGEPLPVCEGIRFDVKKDAVSTGKMQW